MTKLAAVLGHPIAHSRSPRLHGFWLDRYSLNGHYIPLDIAPDDLQTCIRALPKMGFAGCNVTLPHKQAVLPLCDQLSDVARQIGAVNTLVFTEDGKIKGDNTDAYGFTANLFQYVPELNLSGKTAFVLGAGGAARAIVVSLLQQKIGALYISNRTLAKAESLRSLAPDIIEIVAWENRHDPLCKTDLLVNTTALGMAGKAPLDITLDALPGHALVTDIVYTPLMTRLLQDAQNRGLQVVDGLGMLLWQAQPGFKAWFGVEPKVTQALRDHMMPA